MSEAATPIKAGTVVPLRGAANGGLEVLLLKRNSKLDFAAGSWVFPGGRVEPDDAGGDELQSVRNAAVREANEESALDINPKSLIFISHWTTPEAVPKRYATWFFLAEINGDQAEVAVDGSEIVDHVWTDPGEALALHRQGQIELLPPAFVTLTELSACSTPAEAIRFYQQRECPWILPRISFVDQTVVMLYPGDVGYESVDPELEGQKHRVVMAPGEWVYHNELEQ